MHRNAAGIVYASRSKTNPGAEGGTGTQLLPHRVRAVTVRRTVNSLRAAEKLTGSESYAAPSHKSSQLIKAHLVKIYK